MSPYVIPGLKRAGPVNREIIIAAIRYVTTYDMDELNVRNRKRPLVFARQMFFYFMHKYTDITWKDLGGSFGMDHTTAIHAVNKIEGFIKINDPHTIKTIREIEGFLS